MLKFPTLFVEDEKANEIVKQFMNQRLVEMMQDIILEYTFIDAAQEILPQDIGFCNYISFLFPKNYSKNAQGEIFLGLYQLLTGEEEKVPTLIMEYVMNSVIADYIESYDELENEELAQIPERDYVLEKLKETILENESGISPEEVLDTYEDIHNYQEYYFWDIDFELLNTYTEKQIAQSDVNKIAGITDMLYTQRFVVSPDWFK